MTIFALADEVVAAWWITLAVALVVVLVVWALLEQLRRTVKAVDQSVDAVWENGKRLAQNTQTAHLLQGTNAHGRELLEELEQHRGAERRG